MTGGSSMKLMIRMRPRHLGQMRGSTWKDVVSYCASCSICGRAFLARCRLDVLLVCFPNVHLAIRGVIKPLVMVAAPARLEDALPAPSPTDSFRIFQFGRHFFCRQQSSSQQVLLVALRAPGILNPVQTPQCEGSSGTGSEPTLIENGHGVRVRMMLLQGIDLSQDMVRGLQQLLCI